MEASMHAPKNSARHHQTSGCSAECTARIDELTKMVHALEFRVRNLEATAAIPNPAIVAPTSAPSFPHRGGHPRSRPSHTSHGNDNGNNKAKVDTPVASPRPGAHARPQAQVQPQVQPDIQVQAQPEAATTSTSPPPTPAPTPATIIGGGFPLLPRAKNANTPTDEHIRFAQALHAEGHTRDDIVARMLAEWPNLYEGPRRPGQASQLDLVESLVDMNCSRWAKRV